MTLLLPEVKSELLARVHGGGEGSLVAVLAAMREDYGQGMADDLETLFCQVYALGYTAGISEACDVATLLERDLLPPLGRMLYDNAKARRAERGG